MLVMNTPSNTTMVMVVHLTQVALTQRRRTTLTTFMTTILQNTKIHTRMKEDFNLHHLSILMKDLILRMVILKSIIINLNILDTMTILSHLLMVTIMVQAIHQEMMVEDTDHQCIMVIINQAMACQLQTQFHVKVLVVVSNHLKLPTMTMASPLDHPTIKIQG